MSPTSYLTAPPRVDLVWTCDCIGAPWGRQPTSGTDLRPRRRLVTHTNPPPSAPPASVRAAGTAVFAIAFVVLGLPDFGHGVAWPTMRADFDRPLAALAEAQ